MIGATLETKNPYKVKKTTFGAKPCVVTRERPFTKSRTGRLKKFPCSLKVFIISLIFFPAC